MTITDMQLVSLGQYTFRHTMRRRDYNIISSQIELLNCKREQRKIGTMFLCSQRHFLNKGCMNLFPWNTKFITYLFLCYQCIYISIWKYVQNCFNNLVRATDCDKPFLYDCNFHKNLINYLPPISKLVTLGDILFKT